MSDFIVSARKYRPATFASVVGQRHITSTLKNAIERGQLAHAYLFCGPRGVGKTTCARIFAKAINCLSPHGAEACNECESCRSFNEGRSLNIHELDAASNNSVEDIRSLIEQVRIIPQSGRYSVFIIDEVHMLSQAAFNAFLKTLEEPPAHAVFILATTEKHKIIPTILSRCQIYDFNRIRVEDTVGYLRYIASEEGITADDESLNLIAQKADGGMRDALSMFDKAVSFCGQQLRYKEVAQTLNVLDYDTYFTLTEQLLGGDYVSALVAFDEVLSKGFSGQTFMTGLNRHLRDLLVAKNPQSLRLIEMTGTLLERYRTQAAACEVGFLFGAIALLTDLDGKIRQSSNQRLLVELGLMKIAGLGSKKNDSLSSGSYPLPELRPAAATDTPQAPSATVSAGRPVGPAVSPQPASASATPMPIPGSATAERPTMPPAAPDRGETRIPDTGAATAVPPYGPADTARDATSAPSAATEAAGETLSPAAPASAPTAARQTPQSAAATRQTPGDANTAPTADPATEGRTGTDPRTAAGTGPETGTAQASGAAYAQDAIPLQESPAAAAPISAGAKPAGATSAATAAPLRPAGSASRTPLVSGASLSELLSAVGDEPAEEPETGETPDEAEQLLPDADPAAQEKLERARERILALIQRHRPRFVAAFELMEFSGNTIAVTVPTNELRDEILRSKTAMLMRIAELAGIEGPLELAIAVNERVQAVRPIKLEDRVKHMTEKNPLLAELRKALDLELE
ncbi:DNA polymerase III subunit gamma/tau [Alistipes sp. CHKCI003]|uniref:DNA polymerase III subunit gamma/tau n=2 Tax=Alistipes TaxID=239759 RepID=UPI0007A8E570|nr:DNA polymerase III subunit gamma/tau [Alistipes sp. CHKCI003]CVI71655.1 DNA polymerase III subunit tau [Alistipes sp. CHKCI003]